MPKQKRAITTHLEIIISFSIFFAFILFLLIYIKPYKESNVGEHILDNIHFSVVKNISTNLTKIFLKKNSFVSGCFSINLSELGVKGNSLVKAFDAETLDEKEVLSHFSNDIITIDSSTTTLNEFYIFISEEYPDKGIGMCDLLKPENYTIGSVEIRQRISNKSLYKLKKAYSEDYSNLKKEFKIPKTIDFSIVSPGYIYLEKNIPKSIEVTARSYTEEVLFEDGPIDNKEFIFKMW